MGHKPLSLFLPANKKVLRLSLEASRQRRQTGSDRRQISSPISVQTTWQNSKLQTQTLQAWHWIPTKESSMYLTELVYKSPKALHWTGSGKVSCRLKPIILIEEMQHQLGCIKPVTSGINMYNLYWTNIPTLAGACWISEPGNRISSSLHSWSNKYLAWNLKFGAATTFLFVLSLDSFRKYNAFPITGLCARWYSWWCYGLQSEQG